MKTEDFRLLAVQSSLAHNGGLRVLLDLLDRWLAIPEVTPHLFIAKLTDSADLSAVPTGLGVTFGSDRVGRTRRQGPQALARLLRLARRSDVVVSGSEIGESLLMGYVAARLAMRPFIVIVHADLDDAIETWVPPIARGATRWAHAHADVVICVAPGLVKPVLRNGAAPSAVHVVVNGIDVARVRSQAGLAPDGHDGIMPPERDLPLVSANGRLAPQKGFDLLLDAHARVLKAGFPHRVVITGDGPLRQELEDLAASLGVSDSVSLPGFSSNPYKTIATADVFILSSRSEGLPLTLLEALAVGAPVIATECGTGPRTVLGDSQFGVLVANESAESLAQALAAHLQAPDVLRERARAGPERARTFSIDNAATEYLRIIRSVQMGHLLGRVFGSVTPR